MHLEVSPRKMEPKEAREGGSSLCDITRRWISNVLADTQWTMEQRRERTARNPILVVLLANIYKMTLVQHGTFMSVSHDSTVKVFLICVAVFYCFVLNCAWGLSENVLQSKFFFFPIVSFKMAIVWILTADPTPSHSSLAVHAQALNSGETRAPTQHCPTLPLQVLNFYTVIKLPQLVLMCCLCWTTTPRPREGRGDKHMNKGVHALSNEQGVF